MKQLHAIQKDGLERFTTILLDERRGRMHHRRRLGGGRATFVTAIVEEGEGRIFGRVTGPAESHAEYLVEIDTATDVISIHIDLEDPKGGFTIERAYDEILHGLMQMMRNPHKPN